MEGEDIEVLELDFADALAMTRDGRIMDDMTVMLLRCAALDGPFAGLGPGRLSGEGQVGDAAG